MNDSKTLDYIQAAKSGDLDRVEELLTHPEVANNAAATDPYSNTQNAALSFASENGHLNVVMRLLKIKEVANAASTQNNYALRKAAENEHFKVIKQLLKVII